MLIAAVVRFLFPFVLPLFLMCIYISFFVLFIVLFLLGFTSSQSYLFCGWLVYLWFFLVGIIVYDCWSKCYFLFFVFVYYFPWSIIQYFWAPFYCVLVLPRSFYLGHYCHRQFLVDTVLFFLAPFYFPLLASFEPWPVLTLMPELLVCGGSGGPHPTVFSVYVSFWVFWCSGGYVNWVLFVWRNLHWFPFLQYSFLKYPADGFVFGGGVLFLFGPCSCLFWLFRISFC